jgi:hypothetical protein
MSLQALSVKVAKATTRTHLDRHFAGPGSFVFLVHFIYKKGIDIKKSDV